MFGETRSTWEAGVRPQRIVSSYTKIRLENMVNLAHSLPTPVKHSTTPYRHFLPNSFRRRPQIFVPSSRPTIVKWINCYSKRLKVRTPLVTLVVSGNFCRQPRYHSRPNGTLSGAMTIQVSGSRLPLRPAVGGPDGSRTRLSYYA